MALLALRVLRVPERADLVLLLHQPLEVVDEPVAAGLGVLVVHADVDRLLGADLLAVPAEDAPELVDLEDERVAVALLVLARDQADAVGRADLRAEAAGDALRLAVLVHGHAVRPAPPVGERPPVVGVPLLRVLHRPLLLEQVLDSDRHPLQRGACVRRALPGAPDRSDRDRHQSSPEWVNRARQIRRLRALAPPIRRSLSSPKKMPIASARFTAP